MWCRSDGMEWNWRSESDVCAWVILTSRSLTFVDPMPCHAIPYHAMLCHPFKQFNRQLIWLHCYFILCHLLLQFYMTNKRGGLIHHYSDMNFGMLSSFYLNKFQFSWNHFNMTALKCFRPVTHLAVSPKWNLWRVLTHRLSNVPSVSFTINIWLRASFFHQKKKWIGLAVKS